MEKDDVRRMYGLEDAADAEIRSRDYPAEYQSGCGELIPAQEHGKTLFLFVSVEMGDARERELPFEEFAEKKLKLRVRGVAEPTMGVRHYMARVGLLQLMPGQEDEAAQVLRSYPYRAFAAFGDEEKINAAAEELINYWKGEALRAAALQGCVKKVLELGAEFIHASKGCGSFSINRIALK